MSLATLAQKKTAGLAGLAGLVPQTKPDLSSIGGLKALAEKSGLGEEAIAIADTTPKLSFLQRLGKGLGAFNPAEAILKGTEEGVGAGLLEFPKSILRGVGSAITGTDFETERRTFSDVAEKLGIENGIAKFGIGFAGDVLLDPTTYFGGAIAKGIGIVAKGAGGIALKGVGKIAPETETGLRLVGTGLQDALGRAFQFGFKASKGAKEDVLTFLSKEQQAKLGLAASNLDRLGTGVLNTTQREELALKMIAGKRAEFVAREAAEVAPRVIDEALEPLAQEARKFKSAEEFVEAQPKLYHGTSAKEFNQFSGINYFTKDAREAQGFAKGVHLGGGRGGATRVIEATHPMKKIKNVDDSVSEALMEGNLDETIAKELKVAQKEGYDTISFTHPSNYKDGEFTAYVPVDNSLVKTKSQLTDFYNQAVRGGIKTPAEIARETALQGTTPEVAKTIEAQIARSQKMGEGLGLENPYEVYFPFIKKDKLAKFLNESKGIKVGSEGYRKQFKNLLTNENMELDPAKAFFTREAQIVSDKMTRNFLSGFVKKYGKNLDEFKNSDEAAKSGYQLIKEKGAFGKELGYVSEFDAKLIRDSISPEFQTINMLAKATGFDAVTSLFKRAVTGLFAPFHIRNFVSGNIQNFEVLGIDVFNPKNIAIGQKIAYLMGKNEKIPEGLITLGGKEMKFSQVMKPFTDRFSGDTFYNADFDMALKSGAELKQVAGLFSGQRIKETLKTAGLGQEAIPFKVGRAIGQYIEHQQKATAYVTALGQGKSIDEALKLAEAAGFDYRALTRFESQIMRRIIPFYSFTRKNIELQLKTLGENPQRINQILAFFGNIGEQPSEEEKRNLPAFIRESIGIKLKDTPEGLQQYVSSFGTPIEAFTQLFGTNPILRAISTMNPILKVPIELGIGKDSFRQRDLKDVYTANEYKLAPQIIKDLLEIKEVQKPIFKTINGKSVKVGEKIAFVADPEKLLVARSLFTSRGVTYLDQVFGGELEGFVKFLKTTTGIKPQQIDIEAQKFFSERDKKRALEDLLERYGVVKKFEKAFVPKN